MPRNGSGGYSAPFPDFQAGNTILSDQVDANTADIAQAIQDSIARDGQTVYTGNQPMGGFRHTSVSDAAARNQYAAAGQVQDGAFTWCGTATGTANTLTLTPSPPITAHVAGQRFLFAAAAANTASVSARISGRPIRGVRLNDSALAGGEIRAGGLYELVDDGTFLQLSRLNPTTLGHELSQVVTQQAARTAIGASPVLTEANGLVPVGTVIDFAGVNFPSNWLFANGQNVLRNQWPFLFARYGTFWGAGDGSTTFGLPDLRGRVVAGRDAMDGSSSANRLSAVIPDSVSLGTTGGNQQHVLSTAQMPAHSHAMLTTRFGGASPSSSGLLQGRANSVANTSPVPTAVSGSGQAHPNVQPTIALNKLIYAGREVPQT